MSEEICLLYLKAERRICGMIDAGVSRGAAASLDGRCCAGSCLAGWGLAAQGA